MIEADQLLTDQNTSDGKRTLLPPSIYFGGCSWGAAFYIGVHRALVELYGKDFYKNVIITGDSAGSLIALGISVGKSPDEMDDIYKGNLYSSLIRFVILQYT
jgi:predicted acylesterase/phospholipase RssA